MSNLKIDHKQIRTDKKGNLYTYLPVTLHRKFENAPDYILPILKYIEVKKDQGNYYVDLPEGFKETSEQGKYSCETQDYKSYYNDSALDSAFFGSGTPSDNGLSSNPINKICGVNQNGHTEAYSKMGCDIIRQADGNGKITNLKYNWGENDGKKIAKSVEKLISENVRLLTNQEITEIIKTTSPEVMTPSLTTRFQNFITGKTLQIQHNQDGRLEIVWSKNKNKSTQVTLTTPQIAENSKDKQSQEEPSQVQGRTNTANTDKAKVVNNTSPSNSLKVSVFQRIIQSVKEAMHIN